MMLLTNIYPLLLLLVSKQQNMKDQGEPLDEEQATAELKQAVPPEHAFCLTATGYILYENVSEKYLQTFSILRICST